MRGLYRMLHYNNIIIITIATLWRRDAARGHVVLVLKVSYHLYPILP